MELMMYKLKLLQPWPKMVISLLCQEEKQKGHKIAHQGLLHWRPDSQIRHEPLRRLAALLNSSNRVPKNHRRTNTHTHTQEREIAGQETPKKTKPALKGD
jgi:hypothetical protein